MRFTAWGYTVINERWRGLGNNM